MFGMMVREGFTSVMSPAMFRLAIRAPALSMSAVWLAPISTTMTRLLRAYLVRTQPKRRQSPNSRY
jgi:hypothetical protein